MNERSSRDRPSLYDSRKRDRAVSREPEVVSSAKSEIGEEFEVANRVGAQLEIAGWNAVGGFSAEGTQVGGLYGTGEAEVRF